MRTVKVNASTAYDIIIGEGLLAEAGRYCADALGKPCRLCIVSDDNVAPLYLERVQSSLESAGFSTIKFIF